MNLSRLSKPTAALATLYMVTACSSGNSAAPDSSGGIGAPVTSSSTQAAVRTAGLGTAITVGDLTMTISGPASTTPDGSGLVVEFQVSLTNKNNSAPVKGPLAYAVTCNGLSGGWRATSTAGSLILSAGQTRTGTADVFWLQSSSTVQCQNPVTIEAEFGGFAGNLSWTIPPGEVSAVNTAALSPGH